MNLISRLGTKNSLWQRVQRHATMATLFGQQTAVPTIGAKAVLAMPTTMNQATAESTPVVRPKQDAFDWLLEPNQPASPAMAKSEPTSSPLNQMIAQPIPPEAAATHLSKREANPPNQPASPVISRTAQPASPTTQPIASPILNQSTNYPINQPQPPFASNDDDKNWQRLQTIIQRQRAKKAGEVSEQVTSESSSPHVSETAVATPATAQPEPTVPPATSRPADEQPPSPAAQPEQIARQPFAPNYPITQLNAPVASGNDDKNWRRLQTILQWQRAKKADEAAELTVSAPPPPVQPTSHRPTSVQRMSEPATSSTPPLAPHLTKDGNPTPRPASKPTAEQASKPPLEEAWAVQQLPEPVEPTPAELQSPAPPTGQPSVSPKTAVQIKQTLSQISPQQESNSSVQVILPTRPRPQRAQRTLKPAPSASPTDETPATPQNEAVPHPTQAQNAITPKSPNPLIHQPAHAVAKLSNQDPNIADSNPIETAVLPLKPIQRQPSDLSAKQPAPSLIQTQVGPLPADLWEQLGKQPPAPPARETTMRQLVQQPETAVFTQPLSPEAAATTVPIPQMAKQIDQAQPTPTLQRNKSNKTRPQPAWQPASSQPPTIQLAEAMPEAAPIAEAVQPDATEAITEPEEQETPEETADFDIDALSRQVYQQLKRRLAVEWERNRGR